MKKLLVFVMILMSPCIPKAAMQFTRNNTTNYALLSFASNSPVNVSSGDWTMSTWFNFNNSLVSQALINYGNATNNTPILGLRLNQSSAGLLECVTRGDGNTTQDAVYNGGFNDGQWHNGLCVEKSNTLYLYADGVFRASQTATIGVVSTTNLTLGVWDRPIIFEGYTGTMDDVRIYNRALSTQEILTIGRSYERVNITDGLVFYAPLNEGLYGTNCGAVLDRSKFANNMTCLSVVGGNTTPTWVGSSGLTCP